MIGIAIGSISAFVIIQVLVSIFFKWGSSSKVRWLWCFVVANILAFISTWFLMIAYKHLNANITYGVSMGVSFILTQIAFSLIFKSKLSYMQWVLLFIITAGMSLFTFFGF
jgi:multidrug transporter EmrE-like cation transporter